MADYIATLFVMNVLLSNWMCNNVLCTALSLSLSIFKCIYICKQPSGKPAIDQQLQM